MARALASKGLIKVKEEAGLKVTPADITENPKSITFAELDAAQLPRSLQDVDAAVINTNYAMEAGLHPKKDAIAIEGEEVLGAVVVDLGQPLQEVVADLLDAAEKAEAAVVERDAAKQLVERGFVGRGDRADAEGEAGPGGELDRQRSRLAELRPGGFGG